jgi:hypothetical protein
MEWIKIEKEKPDQNRVHYLTDGKTVFIAGTKIKLFFVQLYGEYTEISNFVPKYWTTLPELPNE